MNETKTQLIQTGFTLDRLHQDGKIDNEAYTILKDRNKQAINYIQCCKSDSELLVCVVDYLGNFTKGVKYLCKSDGLKHFEVEDDFGCLFKVHRKCFNKTEKAN